MTRFLVKCAYPFLASNTTAIGQKDGPFFPFLSYVYNNNNNNNNNKNNYKNNNNNNNNFISFSFKNES